jgi:uncharacterized protein (DUF849 family)
VNELIICAQLNEGMTREPNPHVPFTADEIADEALAAREAGAAITHVHARTAEGGMDDTVAGYRALLTAIRTRTDILIAPPLLNTPGATDAERLGVVLDPQSRPDFVTLETGSTNFDLVDEETGDYASHTRLFHTSVASQLRFLGAARESGLPVLATSFNGSWSRAIDIHIGAGRLTPPLLVLLVHGGSGFPAAHPATIAGLRAHRALLPDHAGVEFMVSAHRGDVLLLAEEAIEAGGHVAVGVGDFPHAGRGLPTTAELVAEVADIGRRHGRPPATPEQVRAYFSPKRRTVATQ